MSNEDLVSRAIGAYWRRLRKEGYADCQISQPGRNDSEVLEDRVILRNYHGYMATYMIGKNGRGRIIHSEEDAQIVA